jgi:hypothetical protein
MARDLDTLVELIGRDVSPGTPVRSDSSPMDRGWGMF